jgi:hypothetical protein
MKIHPVGVELSHANRQTDALDEATVAFSNFWNAPEYTSHGQPFQKVGPMYIMQYFTI